MSDFTEEPPIQTLDPARLEKIRSRMRIISNESSIDDIPPPKLQPEMTRSDALRSGREEKWDAKVPPRWNGWRLDTLPAPLQSEAVEWMTQDYPAGRNLILMGPTGSGKTSIAYSVARELAIGGAKTKIWQTADLLDKIRPGDTSKIVLESAKDCQLLVLADLGVEKDTEWTEERIFLIIDHRWQWNLATIIATNLDEAGLADRISDRIYSRLHDDARILAIRGKDYRNERSA